MQTPRPIPSELINSLRYADGGLYWTEPKRGRSLYRPAGTPIHGYQQIKWGGKHWSVHRIIWEMHNGYTELVIDHINRDSQDNRLENLRAISHSANTANQNSGVLFASHNKWRARYGQEHLGYFDNALDAWAKRKSAENHYAQH